MPISIGRDTAIVVLNWNGSTDTIACIRSLLASDASDARIAIFDNGSKAEDRARLAPMSGVEHHASATNLGFAEGNNEAVRRLGESVRWLVFLNNDTEVPATWLAPVLETLQAHAPCIVSPAIFRGAPGDPAEWWFSGCKITWMLGRPVLETGEPPRSPRPYLYVPGCCLAIARADWDRLGGFDPAYFAYFEDIDLCLRAQRMGIHSWLDPRCRIHHKVSRATGEDSPFRIELFTRNRLLFMRRFAPLWAWPPFFATQIAGRLVFALKYFAKPGGGHRYKAFLRGMAAGFAPRPRA
jgi:GT2 family glycosyltransferase